MTRQEFITQYGKAALALILSAAGHERHRLDQLDTLDVITLAKLGGMIDGLKSAVITVMAAAQPGESAAAHIELRNAMFQAAGEGRL